MSFSTGAGSPRIPSASIARVDQGDGPGEIARDLPKSAAVEMRWSCADMVPLEFVDEYLADGWTLVDHAGR